jgi:hypothetical protein
LMMLLIGSTAWIVVLLLVIGLCRVAQLGD